MLPHLIRPQQHSPCPPAQACHTPPARRQVVASAVRKKPGRVAGKQAGSTYYLNYLRNRRARGGEFLGPPLLLADLQQQQQQQQQEPDADAAVEPQQQSDLQAAASSPTSQQTGLPLLEQQQQEQQQQQETQQQQDARHVIDATLDPASIQALLEACLAAAASPLAIQADTNAQPDQLHPPAGQQHQQQQQQVRSRLELQREATKQRQREPTQLYDYVSPAMADSMVSMLKRKGGLAVWPPDIPSQVEPLIQLPALPASHTISSSSTSSTNPASSSSSTDPAAAPPARRRVLHVFWDVSSLHPGGYDPRVLVAQLRRVLGCYGDVAGVYAYGIQKLFNWIPESFMLQYAPDRLPARRRNQQDGSVTTIHSQQPDVQRLLQQAARAGVNLEESIGPLRCRVCGNLRDNYRQLHSHMVQRHKQAAPPLEKLLPVGALADMVAAAIAAAGGSSGSNGGSSGSSAQVGQQQAAGAGAASTAGSGQRSQFTWRVADPWAMRNSSTRTLGRVSSYFNSCRDQFIPPNGHQISLKYVLVREGVEIRTVQRKARAVSAAVADALHASLHGELLTRTAAEVQETQDVLVVVSDQGTHAAVVLEACRRGVPVIAVCGKKKRYKEADITLRWQWVASGRYDTG